MSLIKVRLTRTYTHEPLVHLDGGPFCDAEFTPSRARQVAALLMQMAAQAEARDTTARRYTDERLEVHA